MMTEPDSIQVSIGLPVYNGGPMLATAINSLLGQTYRSFVLYISDNLSTDTTESICREISARDHRVVYTRQEHRLSAFDNFRFVLAQATSKYFVWAACDDERSPDFLEVNLRFLEGNPDYVASTSPTRFSDGDFDERRMGDASLDGELERRFLDFLAVWHSNARFYSLFRRDALAECANRDPHFLGTDWAIILRCLKRGRFKRTSVGWTVLGRKGLSNSRSIFRQSRNHWYERAVPFLALSRVAFSLSQDFSWPWKSRLLVAVVRLNVLALWRQSMLGFHFPGLRRSGSHATRRGALDNALSIFKKGRPR